MSRHDRTAVAALLLLGVLVGIGLVIFAANACPTDTASRPCPAAAGNRALVVALAALVAALLVAPFAVLAEFVARRRIMYRGVWSRAARRAVLVAATVAALAGLRLAGALSVPAALFIGVIVGVVEWFAVRRLDQP